MSKSVMPDKDYKDICNATREKTGTTQPLKSNEVAPLIRSISGGGGGDYAPKRLVVNITKTSLGTYQADRTEKEIETAYRAGSEVIATYDDTETNTGEQIYYLDNFRTEGARFYRPVITATEAYRVEITIDYSGKATIEKIYLANNAKGVFVVTVTDDEHGTLTSSATSKELYAKLQEGYSLICKLVSPSFTDIFLGLVSITSRYTYFSSTRYSLNEDGSVYTRVEQIKIDDKHKTVTKVDGEIDKPADEVFTVDYDLDTKQAYHDGQPVTLTELTDFAVNDECVFNFKFGSLTVVPLRFSGTTNWSIYAESAENMTFTFAGLTPTASGIKGFSCTFTTTNGNKPDFKEFNYQLPTTP